MANSVKVWRKWFKGKSPEQRAAIILSRLWSYTHGTEYAERDAANIANALKAISQDQHAEKRG